jgi:hypothetical protein
VLSFAAEFNVKLVYWHLSDGGFDSAATLKRALRFFGEGAEVVVVRNRGCSSDFSQVEGAASLEDLISRGGRWADLPGLEAPVLAAVDRLVGNLGAALQAKEGAGALTPMPRRRLSRWLSACSVELAPLLRGFAGLDAASVELTEEQAAVETASAESIEAKTPGEIPLAREKAEGDAEPERPRAGTVIQRGSTTWSEVGEGCVIHHVRFT